MQSQQLQNVMSAMENQQATLESMSHSLPVILEQQASQMELLRQCQLTPQCNSDMDTANGGWTVFQKRFDGSVDFHRGWDEYERGFGDSNGEFWLGLQKLHQITQSGTWELRVDLEDFNGNTAYAKYDSFQIGDAASNYRLSIGSYSGTAGDAMVGLNNMQFTTYDRDNDACSCNCAADFYHQGAWWYLACGRSNLNGRYLGQSSGHWQGMTWYDWKNAWESLKKSEMKIRRVQ